jgi:hypothetical protein
MTLRKERPFWSPSSRLVWMLAITIGAIGGGVTAILLSALFAYYASHHLGPLVG